VRKEYRIRQAATPEGYHFYPEYLWVEKKPFRKETKEWRCFVDGYYGMGLYSYVRYTTEKQARAFLNRQKNNQRIIKV